MGGPGPALLATRRVTPDTKVVTVRNLTPAQVTVVGTRRTLRLAPLATEPNAARLVAAGVRP